MVRAISHHNERRFAASIYPDSMRVVQLTWLTSHAAPRAYVFAFGIVMMHPVFAVAVRNVKVAVWCERHAGRLVLVCFLINAGFFRIADSPDDLALKISLNQLVSARVGQVEVFDAALLSDRHSVRAILKFFAPRLDVSPFRVKDDDRIFAIGIHVDSPVRINDDSAVRVPEAHAIRQLGPTFDPFISMLAAAEYDAIIRLRLPRTRQQRARRYCRCNGCCSYADEKPSSRSVSWLCKPVFEHWQYELSGQNLCDYVARYVG